MQSMNRSPSLPLLPGFCFDRKIGCERWHKSSQFEWINGKVPGLVEDKRPSTAAFGYPFPWDPPSGTYPSLYPKKEHVEFPAWIIYDKQILCFEAYFEDSAWEVDMTTAQIRKVKINFYLEDGTLQVNEKKVDNSGLSQGTLLSRQRVPFPHPMDKAFYEVIDFNIGRSVELYGRVYHIYSCDNFTRQWLNRSGVPVPDPQQAPDDPYGVHQAKRKAVLTGRKPGPSIGNKLGQFLKFDGHVLRFFGHWDDSASEGGLIHKVTLLYYLADDTIDVKADGKVLLARCKLPKNMDGPLPLGANEPVSLLNVLSTGFLKGNLAMDRLNVGAQQLEYYKDSDLSIGVVLNIFGRAVTLTSCDAFTRDFYRAKYGLENFGENAVRYITKRAEIPVRNVKKGCRKTDRELPPWNGFGTFEDSERNCLSFIPKAAKKDFGLTHSLRRTGEGSYILRFEAKLASKDPLDRNRNFIVAFYLEDNTTSVFETAARNSGFATRMFFSRKEAFKPVKDLLVPRKPSTFTKEDFWVGNCLVIDGYEFHILKADEYCLRFMELNSQEFPKSNIELILHKIREKLRPFYKKFVCEYLLRDGESFIPRAQFEGALKSLLGDEITPHEILTVGRFFGVKQPKEDFDKQTFRELCQNECKRLLFQSTARLSENLRQMDPGRTGFLPRSLAYSLCRGAKVPIDSYVLNTVLEKVNKNAEGLVSIEDLLSFFETDHLPLAPIVPMNLVREFSDLTKLGVHPVTFSHIDVIRFLDKIGLEEGLKEEHWEGEEKGAATKQGPQ